MNSFIGNYKPLIPLIPQAKAETEHFLKLLGDVEVDAITYGVAFHPHLRSNPKFPFRGPILKVMRGIMLNRSKELRQKAVENPNAAAALNAKADRHDQRLSLFVVESEARKLLDDLEIVFDELESELQSHTEGKRNRFNLESIKT